MEKDKENPTNLRQSQNTKELQEGVLKKALCLFLFFVLCATNGWAQLTGEVTVNFNGKPRTVTYALRLPEVLDDAQPLPIVLCSGGVPMKGDEYIRASTDECDGTPWRKFSKKHKMAILNLGFLVDEEDWPTKSSYQFPYAWSGWAVEQILKEISSQYPVDHKQLYLYGVSGGSQFSVRFAFYRPQWVKGVAAHAAGSYDPPLKKIPTRFLITVGALDNTEIVRKDMAVEFADALKLFDIDHELVIVEGIAHRQTEEQDEMSREFFAKVQRDLDAAKKSKGSLLENKEAPSSLPMGWKSEDVFEHFPKEAVRTHRRDGEQFFRSYFYGPDKKDFLTLQFKGDIVFNWGLNARQEVVDEYLTEFLAGGIIRSYPKTLQAIRNALIKLPQEPFMKVIDRQRPVIFLDVATGGIARYANAIDFYFREEDPPVLSRGFYLIKLGEDLEQANDVEAIEGIILHELTHHVLDHLRGPVDCETEREANRLVKKWGFAEEFKKASEQFGAKSSKDSPCYEERE